MGFVKSAKNGVFWTFLQQISVQAINFVVQIVLARILMPSDFGLIAMISIFIAIGQSLIDGGMTTSLIREKSNTERDYGTVFVTNLMVSVVIYWLVYAFAPFIADFYEQPILKNLLRVYSLVFVIGAFSAVQLARFSKDLKFKIQFTFQLPSVIIGAITGIVCAKLNYGVWSIVWLNIAQVLAFSLMLWVFNNWRPKIYFDKATFMKHFNFGYKLTLSSLLNTVYLNLYKIIIGKQFSPASVGYFTQADTLRLFPINQLSLVLNKVTFPLFASIADDNVKLKRAYVSAMRLVLSISAAMMLVLIIVAKPLFLVVFGDKWLPSVPFFRILCVASIFLPIGTYNLNILKVKGRTDLFFKVELIKKIIGVLCLCFSIQFGIEAMVWSLCITNVFFAYLNGYYSGRFIDYFLTDQIYNSLKIIGLAIVPVLVVYSITRYIIPLETFNNYFQILFSGLSYFLIYVPIVYFFNKGLFLDLKLILKK